MEDAPTPFVSAVLLAAGRSTRMAREGAPHKPLLALAGRTVLEHSCAAFAALAAVREIIVVAHASDIEEIERLLRAAPFAARLSACVPGGEERTDSVRAGIAATSAESDVVLVHDSARPLVQGAEIERVIELAHARGAALVAVPMADTVKASPDGKEVVSTLDRSILWAAQTPQGFGTVKLREVLAEAARDGYRPTDDSALWERYVGPVALVEGDPQNLKLTTPGDMVLAEAILRGREGGS